MQINGMHQIMKHFKDQNIPDRLFGFRLNYSCEAQCFTINDIAKQIDENLQVDTAILDFPRCSTKHPTEDFFTN